MTAADKSKTPVRSKKHHFVPQWLLRRFACPPRHRSIWVFDKASGRSFLSAISDAGSENDFNTVEIAGLKWNFEDLFSDVDARSAMLVSTIVEQRSLAWLTLEDRAALVDLFVTQILRTRFARTTPRAIATQLRKIMSDLGYNPDDDPRVSLPSDNALRISAVRSILDRRSTAAPLARLVPVLFAPPGNHHFILSDDPVALANAFPYGDCALAAHGIMVMLPVGRELAVCLTCPTIIDRYGALDEADLKPEDRQRMARYRDGFIAGVPVVLEPAEALGWNRRQVARSARHLYSDRDDFDLAREMLAAQPELRTVESHIGFGEMGKGPPPRPGMPPGLQLVVDGRFDHCMIRLSAIDSGSPGLVAHTDQVDLLQLVAADPGDLRVELYDDGRARRGMSGVTLELLTDREPGWFRVVHRDPALRALMDKLDAEAF